MEESAFVFSQEHVYIILMHYKRNMPVHNWSKVPVYYPLFLTCMKALRASFAIRKINLRFLSENPFEFILENPCVFYWKIPVYFYWKIPVLFLLENPCIYILIAVSCTSVCVSVCLCVCQLSLSFSLSKNLFTSTNGF